MQAEILNHLLEETWKSPVFGDSFSPEVSLKTGPVVKQINEIVVEFTLELGDYLGEGMPEMPPEAIAQIVAQIVPKTVSFCPALAAGEVQDTSKLRAVSVAIGLMYWGDQTMDRGDVAMPLAIEQLCGEQPEVPPELAQKVQARQQALARIADKVEEFALPEDVRLVRNCFDEQVLLHEVRLHRLSHEFSQADSPDAFMDEHGAAIARFMIVDAGFPSVSSSLYAIYRHQNANLPPLAEVYGNPTIVQLLQVCNAVVRVADEVGDWATDAGHHPEWGSFCINLLNQANPIVIDTFLDVAGVYNPAQREPLRQACMEFKSLNNDAKKEKGEFIVAAFISHAREYIQALPPAQNEYFELYVALCKRVLEIGYINRLGDVALGGK